MTKSTTRTTRVLRMLVLTALGAVMLTGCRFDIYALPLPGGPDTGSNPITVTAEFRDVLDLVPKSTVKFNDVTVGEVTDVELDGYNATVTMRLRNNTGLPSNPTASIRQTSLLGEKFVSLAAPVMGATGKLADGADIPLADTGRNPEIEEVFKALSLILNGGGVGQLKTIASELNKTLDGREDQARSVLTQIQTFARTLDDNKSDIVAAIDALNRLAVTARGQQANINSALDELPSALTSLDKQRGDLVKMLQSLSNLGAVGTRVIKATKVDTIEAIRQLQPIVTELAASGDAFVKSFNAFLTFPFVDEVVGRDPQVARNLQMGDYTNLSIELDVDLSGGVTGIPTTLPTVLPTDLDPTAVVSNVLACIASADITSDACTKVLSSVQALAELKDTCTKQANRDTVVCVIVNQIPGLPQLPGLPGAGANKNSQGADGGSGLLGGLLGNLGSGLGLLRPGIGYIDPTKGPTVRQLTEIYNPSLVTLLVPGMVTK